MPEDLRPEEAESGGCSHARIEDGEGAVAEMVCGSPLGVDCARVEARCGRDDGRGCWRKDIDRWRGVRGGVGPMVE